MHVLDLSSLQDWEILNALIELNPVGIVMLLIQSEKFPHCFVFLSFSTVGDLSGICEFSVKPLFLVAVFDGVFKVICSGLFERVGKEVEGASLEFEEEVEGGVLLFFHGVPVTLEWAVDLVELVVFHF